MSERVFKGRIQHISEVKTGITKTGDNWKKVEFLVEEETSSQYKETVVFTIFGSGDKVSKVDNFLNYNKLGDLVEVKYSFKGREYNGNLFNTIEAWYIGGQGKPQTVSDNAVPDFDEDDDLPFW